MTSSSAAPTATLDPNTLGALKRTTAWLKIAANNLNSALSVLKAHELKLERERVERLLNLTLATIRGAEAATEIAGEVANTEVHDVGVNKAGRARNRD